MAKKKADKPCCELIELVAARAKPTDKLGLMRELAFTPVQAPKRRMDIALPYVIRFRKAPGHASTAANATIAIISYCPFCGTYLGA